MKSRDQHLREQDELRQSHLCTEAGCGLVATMSHQTSQAESTWFCRFHFFNPGKQPQPGEIPRPAQDWRKRALADWWDRLSERQLDAMHRRDGETRSAYGKRMAEIMRRLGKGTTIGQELPYDKTQSLGGDWVI